MAHIHRRLFRTPLQPHCPTHIAGGKSQSGDGGAYDTWRRLVSPLKFKLEKTGNWESLKL